MSGISTHILDTSRGQAAAGVSLTLEAAETTGAWTTLTRTTTDADGRVKALLPPGVMLRTGMYRLRFEVGAYFRRNNVEAFFPHVEVVFQVTDAARHHHVPLLINPFGYSTYRGT